LRPPQSFNDIGGISTRAYTERDVSGGPERLNLSYESILIGKVVSDACQYRRIDRQRNGGKRTAVHLEPVDKFRCHMLRVCRASPIPEKEYSMVCFKRSRHFTCHLADRGDICRSEGLLDPNALVDNIFDHD
jgi:hypothetical protein